ncbi:hypothetical protein HDG32_002893 [Paraburkholderia sp. CI2]|nr:hypothetical protein [Paraburkholderia sp. CI2]
MPRSLADMLPHGPRIAASAARTAASTSSAFACGISAHGSPENGSRLSNHLPERGSTNSLLMNSPYFSLISRPFAFEVLSQANRASQLCAFSVASVVALVTSS